MNRMEMCGNISYVVQIIILCSRNTGGGGCVRVCACVCVGGGACMCVHGWVGGSWAIIHEEIHKFKNILLKNKYPLDIGLEKCFDTMFLK